jgi:uncharacterized protein
MKVLAVRLEDIREKSAEISGEFPVATFPTLAAMEQADEAAFTSPVLVEISAVREFDHIRVNGRVEAGVRFSCSRCLAEYDDRLASVFVLFYTRSKTTLAVSDEEVELSDIDLVSATFSGDEIDLVPVVEEQLIMEFPLKPLCSDLCKGLCSSCGADLNMGDCGCPREAPSLAFVSLKDLTLTK